MFKKSRASPIGPTTFFGSTRFDQLYVFLQGLYKYKVESFYGMIDENDAGKKIRTVTTTTSN